MATKNPPKSDAPVPAWVPGAVPQAAPSLANPFDLTHMAPEHSQSPFEDNYNVDPPARRSPFLPPPPEEVAAVPSTHERPEGTPDWAIFASFIQKHGDQIIRAQYPTPMGEVVDTIWCGVPVTDGPAAVILHKRAGLVSWAEATVGTPYEGK
jgi:hypothetical protein